MIVTLVFLLSIGGAMLFAAPVLVPLHVYLATRSGPLMAGVWALLAGLSVGEVTFFATYALSGERQPFIWLVPLAGFLATGVGVIWAAARVQGRSSPPRRRRSNARMGSGGDECHSAPAD